MKKIIPILLILASCGAIKAQSLTGTPADRAAIEKTKAALAAAFSKGDIDAVISLHHPEIVKYFGGNNVMTGREALRKQLTEWLGNNKVEFLENKVESTIYTGETVIESAIFTIRNTPKNGGAPTTGRGRAVTIFIKYAKSPTGWASIREIGQEAPPQ
jgi:ketosteroid isomerase-like protein